MSQIGVSGGVLRAPPVDAYGNALLPTDGMPPPPGACPDFSASTTLSTNDQLTLAQLFSSMLSDPSNSDDDDGSVTLDPSNLAVVQAMVAQSQAARPAQLA